MTLTVTNGYKKNRVPCVHHFLGSPKNTRCRLLAAHYSCCVWVFAAHVLSDWGRRFLSLQVLRLFACVFLKLQLRWALSATVACCIFTSVWHRQIKPEHSPATVSLVANVSWSINERQPIPSWLTSVSSHSFFCHRRQRNIDEPHYTLCLSKIFVSNWCKWWYLSCQTAGPVYCLQKTQCRPCF